MWKKTEPIWGEIKPIWHIMWDNPFNKWALIIGLGFTFLAVIIFFSSKKKNKSPLLYLPSVWTAIGVLGTFLVLFLKLGYQDFDTSNIPGLIKDLTSAFSTSIIGIGMSLLVSVILKWTQVEFESNKAWSRKSTQEILWLQKEEMWKLNEKFDGVTDEMLSNLSTSLGEVVKSYTIEMKKSFRDLNSAAIKGISDLNTTLKEEVTNVINTNLNVIQDSFSNIKDWQNTSKIALETTSEKFKNAVEQYDDFKFKNEDTLKNVEDQIAKIEELKTNLISLHDKISSYDNRNSQIEECMISQNIMLKRLSDSNGTQNS